MSNMLPMAVPSADPLVDTDGDDESTSTAAATDDDPSVDEAFSMGAVTSASVTSSSAPRPQVGPPPPVTDDPLQMLVDIVDPVDNDVLCGRGGAALRHPGNQTYRRLVNLNKQLYITCLKTEKLKISRSIVAAIREQRGRFLEKTNDANTWYDIGDKKAIEKTSQALREGQPKLKQKMVDRQDSHQSSSNRRVGVSRPAGSSQLISTGVGVVAITADGSGILPVAAININQLAMHHPGMALAMGNSNHSMMGSVGTTQTGLYPHSDHGSVGSSQTFLAQARHAQAMTGVGALQGNGQGIFQANQAAAHGAINGMMAAAAAAGMAAAQADPGLDMPPPPQYHAIRASTTPGGTTTKSALVATAQQLQHAIHQTQSGPNHVFLHGDPSQHSAMSNGSSYLQNLTGHSDDLARYVQHQHGVNDSARSSFHSSSHTNGGGGAGGNGGYYIHGGTSQQSVMTEISGVSANSVDYNQAIAHAMSSARGPSTSFKNDGGLEQNPSLLLFNDNQSLMSVDSSFRRAVQDFHPQSMHSMFSNTTSDTMHLNRNMFNSNHTRGGGFGDLPQNNAMFNNRTGNHQMNNHNMRMSEHSGKSFASFGVSNNSVSSHYDNGRLQSVYSGGLHPSGNDQDNNNRGSQQPEDTDQNNAIYNGDLHPNVVDYGGLNHNYNGTGNANDDAYHRDVPFSQSAQNTARSALSSASMNRSVMNENMHSNVNTHEQALQSSLHMLQQQGRGVNAASLASHPALAAAFQQQQHQQDQLLQQQLLEQQQEQQPQIRTQNIHQNTDQVLPPHRTDGRYGDISTFQGFRAEIIPTKNSEDLSSVHVYSVNDRPEQLLPIKVPLGGGNGSGSGEKRGVDHRHELPADGHGDGDSITQPESDRRRVFAKMKYARPPSNQMIDSSHHRADFHMLESSNSLHSAMSLMSMNDDPLPIVETKDSSGPPHQRIIEMKDYAETDPAGNSSVIPPRGGPFFLPPGVEVAKLNDLGGRRGDGHRHEGAMGGGIDAGSGRSLLSGMSGASVGTLLFSDPGQKPINGSTRSIAMSDISVHDMNDISEFNGIGGVVPHSGAETGTNDPLIRNRRAPQRRVDDLDDDDRSRNTIDTFDTNVFDTSSDDIREHVY